MVTGSVLLQSTDAHRFESNGEIRLERAQVGGALNLMGARLRNPNGVALHAFDASIGGDVNFCSMKGRQFKTRGQLLLSRITVKGRLTCRGALLHDEKYKQPYRREERRRALSLYGGMVNDKVVMEAGEGYRFKAIGFVDLSYARIGAGVICTATKFENPEGTALSLEGAKVTGDVYLTDVDRGSSHRKLERYEQFEAFGDVDLQAVEISGDLSCDGRFRSERYGENDRERGKALVLDNGHVHHRWYVRLTKDSVGEASLRGGRVGDLDDNGGGNWGGKPTGPNANGKVRGIKLLLDGFTYDRFGPWQSRREPRCHSWVWWKWRARKLLDCGVPQNIWVTRKKWLTRQYRGHRPKREDFFPQPHEQAARALLAMGHTFDARRLLDDRAAHQARCGADEPLSRSFMGLYSFFFGCGYLPNRALITLVGWAALGWFVTQLALWERNDNSSVLVKAATSVEIVRALQHPDARPASPSFVYGLDQWKDDGAIQYWPYGRVETRDIACTESDISPLLYAVDTMLPVLDLHMEEKCEVSSDFPWWRRLKAFYAMIGWIIVALTAFTCAGVFRRMQS
jgi:hypothetical protein